MPTEIQMFQAAAMVKLFRKHTTGLNLDTFAQVYLGVCNEVKLYEYERRQAVLRRSKVHTENFVKVMKKADRLALKLGCRVIRRADGFYLSFVHEDEPCVNFSDANKVYFEPYQMDEMDQS